MNKVFEFAGDGWFPRVSPTGDAVCFGGGSNQVGAWVRDTPTTARQIAIGPGRDARFWSDTEVAFKQRVTEDVALLTIHDLVSGSQRVPTAPNVASNEFDVSQGHWAAWRQDTGAVTLDGVRLDAGAGVVDRGVSMAWPYLVTVGNDAVFMRFRNGQLLDVQPLPPRANQWRVYPSGRVAFGYYWEEQVLELDGRITDVSLPWRRASVPVLLDGWTWSATETPNGKFGIVGRHDSWAGKGIVVPFGAVALDVRYSQARQSFTVAACSDVGHLEVWDVPIDTPPVDLAAWGVPITPPEPDPTPEEEVQNAPRVEVIQFTTVIAKGEPFVAVVQDAENPDRKFRVEVDQQGRLWFQIENAKGVARTGKVRQLNYR